MDSRIIPQDFYVYLHRKATTGGVFYVGKGIGRRAYERRGHTTVWRRTVAKHGYTVEIVQDGLQEWAAFELEVALIALHGRRDLGLGPLVNMTDGGEGAAGAAHTPEARAKIRAAHLGRPKAPEAVEAVRRALAGRAPPRAAVEGAKRANTGRKHTAHTIALRVKARTGKGFSARARASYRRRRGLPVVCNGLLWFGSLAEAGEWLALRKGVRATTATSGVHGALSGRQATAYGYKWEYALPPV